jgi:glutamate carboxypeptidase
MSDIGQYGQYLSWLETQRAKTCELVRSWAEVNSWTRNLSGLARMLSVLETELQVLGGSSERIDLPAQDLPEPDGTMISQQLGQALRIRKRPGAPVRVFLGCHMDTVYPPDHPFQQTAQEGASALRGPGVTDAKGGLVIMLTALEAFERCPWAQNLGWEILINPDEEIGSPGSAHLFKEAASRSHLGLLFEPCFPDGSFVGARKGSGNFTVVAHGKAAHAGRDPDLGRNAVSALAWLTVALNAFAASASGITVNVGYLHGGGPVNVVPDRAVCRFNARVVTTSDQVMLEQYLARVIEGIKIVDGISFEQHGSFLRPPKPLDPSWQWLLERLVECGRDLGSAIEWRASGGACDGNNLAAEGLPTVDTLGARGGEIHSSREFVLLDSLTERAQITALFLMKLAAGGISVPADTYQLRVGHIASLPAT